MFLSLVIPAYNEEENIKKGSLDKVLSYFKRQDFNWEIIVVDDGSTDKTAQLIKKKYAKKSKNVKLIEKRHEGKAFSIIEGVRKSGGDWVAFSDFDLATPIGEMEKLLASKEEAEIVIGSRNSRREGAPLMRKMMAGGFILIRDLFVNLEGIKDTQCGFKLFKKKAALLIIDRLKVFAENKKIEGPSVSAGFDIEFLYLAKKLGYRIAEVPVAWHYAETKRVNFVKDSLETLGDIFKIKANEVMGRYK